MNPVRRRHRTQRLRRGKAGAGVWWARWAEQHRPTPETPAPHPPGTVNVRDTAEGRWAADGVRVKAS